jgi:hypothetical protein
MQLHDWLLKKLFGKEDILEETFGEQIIISLVMTTLIMIPLFTGLFVFTDSELSFSCAQDETYSGGYLTCVDTGEVEPQIVQELSTRSEPVAIDRLEKLTDLSFGEISTTAKESGKFYCWSEAAGFLSSQTYCEATSGGENHG